MPVARVERRAGRRPSPTPPQPATIGYPLMVKATAGGGGRGIRRVDDADGLAEAFDSARAEGAKAFGDPTVFMERVVTDARHVEVQLIADAPRHGVGGRRARLQPAAAQPEGDRGVALRRRSRPSRTASCGPPPCAWPRLAGYPNAGTVEFLYQPAEQRFAFLEVNTRLQVEHPVTELTTGLDLVKLQLHVAARRAPRGRRRRRPSGLRHRGPAQRRGPAAGFAPAPGTIETLALPVGPGHPRRHRRGRGRRHPARVRLDDRQGHRPSAATATRRSARLHRALSQTTVARARRHDEQVVPARPARPPGGARRRRSTRRGSTGSTAADEHLPTSRHADVALVAAALDAGRAASGLERRRFLGWASRGRPHADARRRPRDRAAPRRPVLPGRPCARSARPRFAVELRRRRAVVDARALGRARSRLDDRRARRLASSSRRSQGTDHLVEVDGVAHRFSRDDAGIVRAPAAALVVAVDVAPGDVVDVGDRLLVVSRR